MQRFLAGAALVAAFLVMASVFVPLDTGAEPSGSPAVPSLPDDFHAERMDKPAARPSVDPHADLRSIGSVEQASYIVYIYSTESGPRYTIYDREADEELAALLSAERVQELFPQLPLPEIDFSAPVQLMYVPVDGGRY